MSGYTAEMTELYTAEPETEPHIVIAKDKTVVVPEELRAIATQFEKNIETVTFDCPRYWDEHDLSTMRMYINFRRADGVELPHLCGVPTVDEADENIVHFDWTVGNDATAIKGKLSFVAVAKKADEDGVLENRWGSRLCQDMEILEGIEPNYGEILEPSADIIEQILYKLDTAAAVAVDAAERAIAAAQSATVINKNLLDNWYFADPVNQRGKTEYSANWAYSIDRWKLGSGDTHVILRENGIETHADFQQCLNMSEFTGEKYTFSVLSADNRLGTYTFNRGDEFNVNIGNGFAVGYIDGSNYWLRIYGSGLIYVAAKLEIGDKQTLAHQDADGNWVLNEIPDKGMELLKCCMSTADPTDDYANNKKTPAAVGAVNKAGDTMTGDLIIKKSNSITTVYVPDAGGAMLQAYSDWNKRKFLWVPSDAAGAGFNDIQYVDLDTTSGKNGRFDILHTGNKPRGSYTGNGDAAERTIETGGKGDIIFLRGQHSVIGFACYYGGVMFNLSNSTTKYYTRTSFNFTNGVLTIATSDAHINFSGTEFYYQVL